MRSSLYKSVPNMYQAKVEKSHSIFSLSIFSLDQLTKIVFKIFQNSSETVDTSVEYRIESTSGSYKEKLKVLTDEIFFKYFVIYHKSDSDSESSHHYLNLIKGERL